MVSNIEVYEKYRDILYDFMEGDENYRFEHRGKVIADLENLKIENNELYEKVKERAKKRAEEIKPGYSKILEQTIFQAAEANVRKKQDRIYDKINKFKGLYLQTGALARLLIEHPEEYKMLKEGHGNAFDYASAEGAAQAAKYTYEEIRKRHPGNTPEDKVERIREVKALAKDGKTDSQQAELVQAIADVRGDRDTVDHKKVEKTLKLYDQWIRDAKSNPVVFKNYQEPAQRAAYIKGELNKLKSDPEFYATLVSSVMHGDIKVSDDLKSIIEEHAAVQSRKQARYGIELEDLSGRARFELWKKGIITIDGITHDQYVNSSDWDALSDKIADSAYHHPEKCKEVRRVKINDLSQEELDRLAQNGKIRILHSYTDENGNNHRSYTALTAAQKAKGDEYWIKYNKEKCPELFGKTEQKENTAENNKSNEKPEETNEKPAKTEKSKENTGTSKPAKTAESQENADNGNGDYISISSNMDYALKMGPTVLKEYMEKEFGIEFPASIIRHNAEGGEYIPTRLLRKWFEENSLTDEQIEKLNALVDDRESFNTKVREINERDNYVAPSAQNESEQSEEQSEEQSATKQAAAENGDIAKLKQYAAKGNMMTNPAILREMKEKDPELYSTLQRTLREYLNPDKGTLHMDDMFNAISDIARGCGLNQPGTMDHMRIFSQNVMNVAYGIDNANKPAAEEKRIKVYQNEKGETVYKVSGYGTTGTINGKELLDGTYSVKKGNDYRSRLIYTAPDSYYEIGISYHSNTEPTIMRTMAFEIRKLEQQRKEEQKARKRQEDAEKMRELLRNNPKKFEDVKNAYKAAMKNDAVKDQAEYYLGIIEEVERDEATKEKVRKEKERAIKKLEKEIKKLEKEADKMRKKGQELTAAGLDSQAEKKRELLEQMRNDRENALNNGDKKSNEGAAPANKGAKTDNSQAVEQQILDARKRGGNSMA